MIILELIIFIIVGIIKQGKKFCFSDWVEWLCGVMFVFGVECKMKYFFYVGFGDYNGEKVVFVDGCFSEIEFMVYCFMFNFV